MSAPISWPANTLGSRGPGRCVAPSCSRQDSTNWRIRSASIEGSFAATSELFLGDPVKVCLQHLVAQRETVDQTRDLVHDGAAEAFEFIAE